MNYHPVLSLAEFAAALRAAYPDAGVSHEMTFDLGSIYCHSASLTIYGCHFVVEYRLLSDPAKRWATRLAGGVRVSTPEELRPLIAAEARVRAAAFTEDAAGFTASAERFFSAAKLLEVDP